MMISPIYGLPICIASVLQILNKGDHLPIVDVQIVNLCANMNKSLTQIHPSWCSLDPRPNSCTAHSKASIKERVIQQTRLVESDVHCRNPSFRMTLPRLSLRINFAFATRKRSTSIADGGTCKTKEHQFSPERVFSTSVLHVLRGRVLYVLICLHAR